MASMQDRPSPFVLVNKPSSSFSSVSSAASATLAATSRTGCAKLLFGEIDTSSDRSSESYASVCSFVLCDSGTFLKLWLEDQCRDKVLSYLPKADLASLRLACHDFSVRAAPALFSDLAITFKTSTFTKPARLAALDRLGFYVKTLSFKVPHTAESWLPPLVEPDTGEEMSFSYTPQIHAPSARRPKYGDAGTMEILTRQYPALFHAATNVPAFVRAFSALINLQHLKISCPGYDPSTKYRRSIVDFALISIRVAVEQNCLNALDSLTLSPLHAGGLLYLSPLVGYGATPRSARVWSRIQHLNVHLEPLPATAGAACPPDHFRLLQTYLRNFQANLATFEFRWHGAKGPLPFKYPELSTHSTGQHPAKAPRAQMPLYFLKLKCLDVGNVAAMATEISNFAESHKTTLEDVNLEDVKLVAGTWDEALAPLTKQARRRTSYADIPIMLSSMAPSSPTPAPMERIETATAPNGRSSMRISRWLSGRRSRPASARKVREGLLGCEEQLRKVLGVLPWK